MTPTVSVIIPTLNAADRICQLIRVVKSQTIEPIEIYVVDSSSEDETVELAQRIEGVTIMSIDRESFDHGMTRHKAFLSTRGDFVCFLTDDAIPNSNTYIEKLIAPLLEDDVVAMASGRQLPKPDARRFEQLVRQVNYGPDSHVRSLADFPKYGIKTFFATDVCSIYRRSAYLAVGGFPACDTNEDMLMASRFINSGLKVAYAADAEVLHSHNLSPQQQYSRNRRVGVFLVQHEEELRSAGELNEGLQLAKRVSVQLLKECRVVEFFAFGIDCVARFAGNRAGRKIARRMKGSY